MSFGEFNQQGQFGTKPMSEINTTPLVDVMLVLLIIFIITAPLITNNINVDLPNSKSSTTKQKPSVVNVGLDKNGQMFWNGKKIEEADLSNLLHDALEANPETEMRLQADRTTYYERITQIMTEAKKAGINKIGFETKVEN